MYCRNVEACALARFIVLLGASAALAQICPSANFQAATASVGGSAAVSGTEFQVQGIDELMDFYGEVSDPQLVVFLAGNQFMVVPDLISAFKKSHPEVQRVFVETIPPGVLAQQVEQGALKIGSMRLSYKPDVFAGGRQSIKQLQEQHHWFDSTRDYAKNGLVLMVRKGNPKNIVGLSDLARPDVTIVMPNPAFEGIARQIQATYVKAGGESLRKTIMDEKTAKGDTILTQIHHRQSAACVIAGAADVAPVWSTEGEYQKRLGHAIDLVSIPAAQNSIATYSMGWMRDAPHSKVAKQFVEFVSGPEGQAIYRKYGFEAVQ